MSPKLTITDHSRDVAGLNYVYPVISRRAGGLSIGVNFNTNNACNWRCIYCQVPGLIKGAAPDLDLPLLAQELSGFIQDVLHGDFYEHFQVPEQQRLIKDIAISGNGEPTTAANFAQAMALIGEVVEQAQIPGSFNTVLITNGSLMHHQKVQQGLVNLHEQGGRVWFKLDSATREGQLRINNAATSMDKVLANLQLSSSLCPTWLQTCVFLTHDRGISQKESDAYLEMLAKIKGMADIKGVLLYTLARPSHQPEADSLAPLPMVELNAFADAIKCLGFKVKVSG